MAHARSFGTFCFRSVTGLASAFQTAGVGHTFLSVGVRNGNVGGVRQQQERGPSSFQAFFRSFYKNVNEAIKQIEKWLNK